MTDNKPNVLFILVDQLSAETLGLYGNPVLETPALARLADRGVIFDRAYCNYPACAPSRSSMLTGRYAHTIRNHANHMLLDPREITITHTLRAAGYQTAIVGKNHAYLTPQDSEKRHGTEYPVHPPEEPSDKRYDEIERLFDFAQLAGHGCRVSGFDDPEMEKAHQWAMDHCWRSPAGYGTNPHDYRHMGSHLIGDATISFLREKRDPTRPFFLWLSFPDPHTPFQTPEPYASLFPPESIPLPPTDDLAGKPERQRVAHLMDAMDTVDEDHLRALRSIHYGMTRFVDDNIGRVLDTLDELELTQDTLIIFTADHGDSMGAHGLIQKHNCFYDSVTRVPFIAAGPGVTRRGRSAQLVELVDIVPTFLDMAGVELPLGLQGRSMGPYLRQESEQTKDYIVIESGEAGDPPTVADITFRPKDGWDERYFVWCAYREAWMGRGKAIRDNRWKLALYENGDGELYDLQQDPNELTNLYHRPEHQETVVGLERKLLRWCMATEDVIPENKTAGLSRDTFR